MACVPTPSAVDPSDQWRSIPHPGGSPAQYVSLQRQNYGCFVQITLLDWCFIKGLPSLLVFSGFSGAVCSMNKRSCDPHVFATEGTAWQLFHHSSPLPPIKHDRWIPIQLGPQEMRHKDTWKLQLYCAYYASASIHLCFFLSCFPSTSYDHLLPCFDSIWIM